MNSDNSSGDTANNNDSAPVGGPGAQVWKPLPPGHQSLTHKFEIGGHEGFIHVGIYDDGTPGQITVRFAREGSTISGLMDGLSKMVSTCLQHGVPLQELSDQFIGMRFDPSGWTGNPDIPKATSVVDYMFQWLYRKFILRL